MDIKSDQTTTKDSLNRRQFAEEIASNIFNYLKNNDESLVIGINGTWGSGKSTLLGFIKEEYTNKKESNFKLFEFNPWMFSGKHELHSTFLNEFSIAIGHKKQKLRNTIEKISNGLSWAEEMGGIGKSVNRLSQTFYKVSILDLKKEVNKILIKEKIRTLVLIDDVDRLSPSEILEIFQLIRLNANFSNTIFLICFDKAIVKNSITNEFKIDGEKYLEKIIQVDYSLPSMLPEDIEHIFYQTLDRIVMKYSIDFQSAKLYHVWNFRGLKNHFKNIRDINRYFNAIQFRLPSFHKNVSVLDFLIIEAIRIFDYSSYETIRNYLKEVRQFGKNSRFSDELNKVSEGATGELYRYLFEKKYLREDEPYRIIDMEFFDRYFTLSISKRDMKEEDLQMFLNLKDSNDRILFLKNVIESEKMQFLLMRLALPSSYNGSNIDSKGLISSLLGVWIGYEKEFLSSWRNLWNVLKIIISRFEDKNDGFQFLLKEISLSDMNFNPARFVLKWFLLKNTDEVIDKDILHFIPFLKAKKSLLEESIKKNIGDFSGSFFYFSKTKNFYALIFLTSRAQYLPETYVGVINHILENENGIFILLNIFVNRDSTTSAPFGVDPKYISLLLPQEIKENFHRKLKAIDSSILPKNDGMTIQYFLEYLDQENEKIEK